MAAGEGEVACILDCHTDASQRGHDLLIRAEVRAAGAPAERADGALEHASLQPLVPAEPDLRPKERQILGHVETQERHLVGALRAVGADASEREVVVRAHPARSANRLEVLDPEAGEQLAGEGGSAVPRSRSRAYAGQRYWSTRPGASGGRRRRTTRTGTPPRRSPAGAPALGGSSRLPSPARPGSRVGLRARKLLGVVGVAAGELDVAFRHDPEGTEEIALRALARRGRGEARHALLDATDEARSR